MFMSGRYIGGIEIMRQEQMSVLNNHSEGKVPDNYLARTCLVDSQDRTETDQCGREAGGNQSLLGRGTQKITGANL